MKKLVYITFNLFIVAGVCAQTLSDKALRKEFARPSLTYRMGLNTHGTPHEPIKQDSILDSYLRNGYGALATNVNWTDDYLKNEGEMHSMFRFVRSARSKGMDVWLYDENWYPSGMANTYILDEHPQWECEGLMFRDTVVRGEGRLVMPLLKGRLVLVKAMPVIDGKAVIDRAVDISLSSQCTILDWSVPAGEWHVAMIATDVLHSGYQAGTDRGGRMLHYPSLLMPEVGQRFVELTHKRYREVLGSDLSSLFSATFTDEPSTMAQPYTKLGYGVYPWKSNVSAEFAKRYGSSLEDNLLWLMLDEGPHGQQARYTYFGIISDFMSNHYFKAIKDYCNSQGILSGGHLLLEETMMSHVPLYGSIMSCFRQMDVPGIDVLTVMPWFTRRYLYSARMASSAAELEGRSMVMSEVCPVTDPQYHNGKEAPTIEAKGTLNRQIVGGVNKFNNYLQMQHEDEAGRTAMNEYVARVTAAVSGGVRASRIAVYYPIETMWTRFRPMELGLSSWDKVDGGDPGAQQLDGLFDKVSNTLYDNQYEFCYIDAQALRDARTQGQRLSHGELAWDVVVLPCVETIDLEAIQKLAQFAQNGGTVIALEALPQNSPTDFPSSQIKALAEKIKTSENFHFMPQMDEKAMCETLNRTLPRHITLSDKSGILISHRFIGGKEVFFLINDTGESKKVDIQLSGLKSASMWNPQNGKVSSVNTSFTLELQPYEGQIIRATKQ